MLLGLASASVPVILAWAGGWIVKEKLPMVILAYLTSVGFTLLTVKVLTAASSHSITQIARKYL